MIHIRLTDALPLRELAPGILELLQDGAEPGGQVEVILEVRPDALVVAALTPDRCVGAAIATREGDLAVVVEEIPQRWDGWQVRKVSYAA